MRWSRKAASNFDARSRPRAADNILHLEDRWRRQRRDAAATFLKIVRRPKTTDRKRAGRRLQETPSRSEFQVDQDTVGGFT